MFLLSHLFEKTVELFSFRVFHFREVFGIFVEEEAGSLVERRKRQDIIRMKYVGVISIESKIETIGNLVKDDYLKLAELRI